MILLLKVLLFLAGLYVLVEGSANLAYWQNKPTRYVFQVGRFVRAFAGFIIVLISIWGN
jgi:hypothetical protein